MRFMFLTLSAILFVTASSSNAESIHDYARKGDVAGIAATLDAGADVNDYDGFGSPLTYAVRKGHYSAAKLLIEHGADVNIPTRYYGDPVMIAAARSRADLMELLLEHGAIPDSTLNGEPVLHVAAKLGCFSCVKALVEAGADVNWEFRSGCYIRSSCGCYIRSALGTATILKYNDIAAYLRAHGATKVTWVMPGRH
jgi:cytochrome c